MSCGTYRSWLFDCDGVILDSNRVKTAAFYEVALPFGADIAEQFVAYHTMNGGISRGVKFRYLFEVMLGRKSCDDDIARATNEFAIRVREGLRTCALVPGIAELLPELPKQAFRAVISGGAESELREVFAERGLAKYFNVIRGSPDAKDYIMSSFAEELRMPAVYFGDSRLDHEVACRFNADFVFVSGCTEFSAWESYFAGREVSVIRDFVGLPLVRGEAHAAQS